MGIEDEVGANGKTGGIMMNCDIVSLKEQKYIGIKTKIYFKEHDSVNFHKLAT